MIKEFQEFIAKGNVMDLAVGVIKGEKSTEGLETAVAVYDALAEKGNSAAAATDGSASIVRTCLPSQSTASVRQASLALGPG